MVALDGIVVSQQIKFQSLPGTVSFISPQNVYVKFTSTRGIAEGDTIFYDGNGMVQPALIAKYMSSQSCAGPRISNINLKVGDHVFALAKTDDARLNLPNEVTTRSDTDASMEASANTNANSPQQEFTSPKILRSRVYGSFTTNTYSTLANDRSNSTIQRYSHTLFVNAENIDGSRFYFSTNSTLSYLATEWSKMKSNIFNDWQIYDASAGYKQTDYNIWFGRRINYYTSNIGPIDGLQGESRFGDYWVGGLVGSRPDFYNLSFDLRYFEVGAYLNRTDTLRSGLMQNTLGIFQQTNDLRTDRRFLYLQHNSVVSSNLSFFASTEVDLFKLRNHQPTNTFSLTSLYLSTQYSPTRSMMVSLTFDARRDVIYYQTFATTFDSLFQNQLRQGVQLWMNWRPWPALVLTLNDGYDYQNGDPAPSRNFAATLTEPTIPVIDLSASVSYTRIIGGYLNGSVYGLTFSEYVPFNSSSIMVEYQRADYNYGTFSNALIQNIGTAQVSTRTFGQLFLNLYYEGTFSHQTTHGSLVGGFTFRF